MHPSDAITAAVGTVYDSLDRVKKGPPAIIITAVHGQHDPAGITRTGGAQNDALLVLLPLLIVLSTLLFLLLLFLVFVLLFKRRRSIALRDRDGPVDLSREDFSGADGGFDGLESRWLEGVSDLEQRQYHRVKGQCYPNQVGRLLIPRRVPAAVPAQLSGDRYHSFPIPDHSGKGRFCLVF